MERHMAAVGRLLERQQFASIDEANAAISALLAQGDLPSVTPETPLDQAQELVYRAMEATGPRRQRLAQQALALSPECVDAYVLLAESTTDSAEALRLYELGVQAGERALGPEVFAEEAGHFWGLLETRPYMRAREGLAEGAASGAPVVRVALWVPPVAWVVGRAAHSVDKSFFERLGRLGRTGNTRDVLRS
jgi:hypothetical protein